MLPFGQVGGARETAGGRVDLARNSYTDAVELSHIDARRGGRFGHASHERINDRRRTTLVRSQHSSLPEHRAIVVAHDDRLYLRPPEVDPAVSGHREDFIHT